MNRPALQTSRESDYQTGLDDGIAQAAKCNDESDVIWYQRVVWDNLYATRPHYVAGYLDGFKAV